MRIYVTGLAAVLARHLDGPVWAELPIIWDADAINKNYLLQEGRGG